MVTPVLHVITRLAQGGAAENTIYTVNGLDPARWKVDLAIGGGTDEDDRVDKLAIAGHVTVHRVPSLVRNPSIGEFRALADLRKLIRAGGYRVIHTHGAKAGILGRIAGRQEGVPVLINGVHGHTFSPQLSLLPRTMFRILERRTARYTTHFVSVGADLRDQYLAAEVGKPDQWTVVHSGMELERFIAAGSMPDDERSALRSELGIPATAVVFTMVGRMESRKGHRFFLEAAARMDSSDASHPGAPWFVIVGDGPEQASLSTLAAERGIDQRTVFTGYRRDVEKMFGISDVVVLTSLWEGLPRVLVQAAAAGKPAISFACDGAHEAISDGVNGWVVAMKDVAAVADGMTRLAQDDVLRKKMGAAGIERVNASWTVEAMVTEIDKLYQRLLTDE